MALTNIVVVAPTDDACTSRKVCFNVISLVTLREVDSEMKTVSSFDARKEGCDMG